MIQYLRQTKHPIFTSSLKPIFTTRLISNIYVKLHIQYLHTALYPIFMVRLVSNIYVKLNIQYLRQASYPIFMLSLISNIYVKLHIKYYIQLFILYLHQASYQSCMIFNLPRIMFAFQVGRKYWVSRYLALKEIVPPIPNRNTHVEHTNAT